MKKLLILLCVASIFASCEDIQDNSPAFQAELDDVFFRAIGSGAFLNDDGSITIQASTQDETLTLFVSNDVPNVYTLGDDNPSFATFKDASDNLFTTVDEGFGSVTLSEVDPEVGVSGSFVFNAVLPGVDTLVAQKGLFFQVPFLTEEIEDPGNDDEQNTDPDIPDGVLVANLDGQLFEPTTVIVDLDGNLIIIRGHLGDESLTLIIRSDSETGIYQLPHISVNGTYELAGSGVTEAALSGNIRIFEHDMTEKTIKGTFSYTTENHQITLGQFNVAY